MLAQLLSLPGVISWDLGVPLLVGFGAGLVSVAVGKVVMRRRTALPPPKEPKPEAGPNPDPFLIGSTTEQRKSLRRGGNPVEVFIAPPNDKNNRIRGWVLDRSVGGLCMMVDEELAKESQLSVLPVNAPTMTPWVDVVIKQCRHTNNGWELGCQFTRTPPWSVLLMFG